MNWFFPFAVAMCFALAAPFSVASAATLDASAFNEGDDVSEFFDNIMLSAVGNAVSPFDDTVVVTESATVSTNLRIGYNNLATASPSIVGGTANADLIGIFDSSSNAEVSVTFIGNGDPNGSVGELTSFDSGSGLDTNVTTNSLGNGQTQTLALSLTDFGSFEIGQFGTGSVEVTSIMVNVVPEPASLALFAGLGSFALVRRRKQTA